MSQYINKRTLIDGDTGEVLKEHKWLGFDGFTDKGYSYRPKCCHIKFYFDSMPGNFDSDTYLLMFCLAELMNNDNVLVYRVKRKSKFSNIIYKPFSKDEIRDNIRFPFGINRFDRCWRELCKKTVKRIKYNDFYAWAVNPSVVSKCKYVPFWLYEEFQESMNPHLSALTINKLSAKVAEYYQDEN